MTLYWCIRDGSDRYWGLNAWGDYLDRIVYTESEHQATQLPRGGEWDVDSSTYAKGTDAT